jgi:hypothetical protein
MNNESGSTLQKINFVLLLLIAAALGYLIARNRIDGTAAQPAATSLTPAAPLDAVAANTSAAPTRSSFAPLRARVETNGARAVPARAVVVSPDKVGLPAQVVTDASFAGTPAPKTCRRCRFPWRQAVRGTKRRGALQFAAG